MPTLPDTPIHRISPITSGAFQKKRDQPANIGLATGVCYQAEPERDGACLFDIPRWRVAGRTECDRVDSTGDAYVSGVTFSRNFPVTSGAYQKINNSAGTSGFNAFVTKLNPTGSALVYSTYLGGGNSGGAEIGQRSTDKPNCDRQVGNGSWPDSRASGILPVNSTPAFSEDVEPCGYAVTVSKLNPTGSGADLLDLSRGQHHMISEGLAIDSAGNAYVAGYTSDQDFPVTKGAFQTTNKADTNTSISSDCGEQWIHHQAQPHGLGSRLLDIFGRDHRPVGRRSYLRSALDSAENAYVTGGAMSADFPVTANAYQPTNHGATHCCDYYATPATGF